MNRMQSFILSILLISVLGQAPTPAPTPAPCSNPQPVGDDRFVIGYVPNWSQYRTVVGNSAPTDDYRLTVENVNYCQLTHVIYSFANVQLNDFHINDPTTMNHDLYDFWVGPPGDTAQLDNFRNDNSEWQELGMVNEVARNDDIVQAGEVVPFEWNDHTQWQEMKTAIAAQGATTKMLLSIGGWTAGTLGFHEMAKDPLKRKRFVKSLLAISLKFGFEGVDLDWEYPGWITTEDDEETAHRTPFHNVKHKDGGRIFDLTRAAEDIVNFCSLITELRNGVNAAGLTDYTISAAVKANPGSYLYNRECMKDNLDWIGLMNYDYHGAWDKSAGGGNVGGHTALTDNRLQDNESTTKSWEYWSSIIPKKQLVVGLATYGKGFPVAQAGADVSVKYATTAVSGSPRYMHDINGLTTAFEAPYLKEYNTYTWYEIKDYWDDRDNWYYDPDNYIWAVKNNHYVAFDDECTLVYKAKWALDEKDALGVMIWEISYDDVEAGFPMTHLADYVARDVNSEIQCTRGSGNVNINTRYLAASTEAPTPAPSVACTPSNWGAWGPCSVTCGGGTSIRGRIVDPVGCTSMADSMDCNTASCPPAPTPAPPAPTPASSEAPTPAPPAPTPASSEAPTPVPCTLSGWSAWGTCSVTCGDGKQTRTRSITESGPACPTDLTETMDCNTGSCTPSPGCTLSDWSAWGTCDVTCGGGTQTRTRSVTETDPACQNDLTESMACNTASCPPQAPTPVPTTTTTSDNTAWIAIGISLGSFGLITVFSRDPTLL